MAPATEAPAAEPPATRDADDQDRQAANGPLLLITPGPSLDYARLGELVAVVDHYYESVDDDSVDHDSVNNGLRHRLIGIARRDDLTALERLPLEVRLLDARPAESLHLWVSARNLTPERLKESGARLLATRSRGATALLAVSGDQKAAGQVIDWVRDLSPEAVRVSVVDCSRLIEPGWIDPSSLERNRRMFREQPLRETADPAIKSLAEGVDAAACQLLLQQLTGQLPIDAAGGDVVIRSRFATHADMPVLTQWLTGRLNAAGLDAGIDEFTSPVHPSHGTLPQVVASIPGTDLADEIVMVTAHLDSVRGTPGADDNASGITALVAAAEQLAKASGQFRRTIRFVAFNDEEQGLIGSSDYARRLRESDANVVGVLNMDMLGYDKDGDGRIQLQSNGTPASNALCDRLVAVAAVYGTGPNLVRIVDPEESSDYAAFWRVGYPAINIGDEYFLCDGDCVSPLRRGVRPPEGDFTPCYHLPSDRIDDAGFRFELVVQVARHIVASVADIAEMTP